VGLADTATGVTVPFFWKEGVMTALPIPSGHIYGLAQGINNQGLTVGFSLTDFNDLTTEHALLWRNGVLIDLRTKIPAGSGWTLLQAGGINDRGQISGFGIHNGDIRAYLLTPKHHGEHGD